MQDLAEDNVACRICMDNKDNCVSLFSQDLSKKIMEIAAVQVEKDDGLPDSICTDCENDLEKCYEFRLKVQVADKKFRENIKFSQVDIAECNIKQERYHIDDGNFDNVDENDSVSMDDEHYSEELDVEQPPRSTGEVEPDPLNHVVVVEEKERKIEMAEYTLSQDDAMSEEPQLKTVEEPAVDPLVCMKEETDAEVMDVDSNQPDPFGPSVSVRSAELLHSLPIAFPSSPRDELDIGMKQITVDSPRENKALEHHSFQRIPLLPNSSHCASASVQFHKDRSREQSLVFESQMTSHPNSRSLFPNVNNTHDTCAFPYNNVTCQDVNQGYFERENGYFTTAMRNVPKSNIQNSYWDYYSNTTQGDISIHVNNRSTRLHKSNIQNSYYSNTTQACSNTHVNNRSTRLHKSNIQNRYWNYNSNTTQDDSITHVNNHSTTLHKSNIQNSYCDNYSNTTQACSNTHVNNHNSILHKSNIQNRYCDNYSNTSQASSNTHVNNHSSILPTLTEETKVHDTSNFTSNVLGKNTPSPSHGKENVKRAKKTQSSSSTLDMTPSKVTSQCENEFFCPVCNVDYGTTDLLDEHRSGNEFICRACTEIFSNHQELETHFYGHRKHICKVCDKVFYVQIDLTKHRNTVAACKKPTMLKCEICYNRFKFLQNLQDHMKNKHPKGSQPLTCQICNTSVRTIRMLKNHMRVKHTVYESVECDICHSVLSGPERLKAHIKLQHLQTSSAEACPICKKVFSCNSAVKTHLESHIGEENICNICGAVVKGKMTFKSHLSRHNRKMFPCSLCNLVFNSQTEKSKHYHENHGSVPKPVICEICGKEYKSKYKLKDHMLVHSGVKPYVCEVCGSAFKQKVALKTHSRIHSDLRKYCCNQCGKDFRWKQTFDKHVLKCKPINNEEISSETKSE